MADRDDQLDLLPLLDELRAMAQTGLHFADGPYDAERYERILELVAEYYGECVSLPPEAVRKRLATDLGEITPKVASLAAVFDESERVLVIERADGTGWCLPGGKLDFGESTAEAAEREVREETGAVVEAAELVDTYPFEPPTERPQHTIVHLYRCERVGGELTTTHESKTTEFRRPDDVHDWATTLQPELIADAQEARQ